MHAYELGDLDDFFWPRTRWFGWRPDGRIEQVALVYDEPDPPVLLALAEEPEQGMADLLRAIARGAAGEALCPPLPRSRRRARARARSRRASLRSHRKLGLVDPTPPGRARYARRGARSRRPTSPRSRSFYARAYPGTWFQPRMLETGRYVGIRRDGLLVCVAGVHVWSPTWGVAALGNVATVPALAATGSRPRRAHASAACCSTTAST